MNKFLKKFIFFLLTTIILMGLLVGLLIIFGVNHFIRPEKFTQKISQAFYKKTGRQLTIEGPVQFSVFPALRLIIHKGSIGNQKSQFTNALPLAEFSEAEIKINWLPLLSHQIDIDKLILRDAQIHLYRNQAGQNNWSHWHVKKLIPNKNQKVQISKTSENAKSSDENSNTSVDESSTIMAHKNNNNPPAKQQVDLALHLAHLEITHGLVTFQDEITHRHFRMDKFALRVTDIHENQPVPFDLSFQIQQINPALTGNFSVHTSMIFNDQQRQVEFRHLQLFSTFWRPNLPDGRFTLGIDTTVFLNFETSGATLKVNDIDVKSSLGEMRRGDLELRSIRKRPLDQFRGSWHIAHLRYKKMVIDNLQGQIQGEGKRLVFAPITADFYEGRLNAALQIDNSQQIPTYHLSEQLTDVQAGSLLGLAGVQLATVEQKNQVASLWSRWKLLNKKISGIGSLKTELTTSGNVPTTLRKNLNGQLSFSVQQGQLSGFNFAYLYALGRSLVLKETPPDTTQEDVTRFKQVQGSFNIQNGIASTQDLMLDSEVLQMTGSGQVDLMTEVLDFALILKPTLGTIDENSSPENTKSVAYKVPIAVTGTISHPKIHPDMTAIFTEQARRQLDQYQIHIDEDVQKKILPQLKKLEDKLHLERFFH